MLLRLPCAKLSAKLIQAVKISIIGIAFFVRWGLRLGVNEGWVVMTKQTALGQSVVGKPNLSEISLSKISYITGCGIKNYSGVL